MRSFNFLSLSVFTTLSIAGSGIAVAASPTPAMDALVAVNAWEINPIVVTAPRLRPAVTKTAAPDLALRIRPLPTKLRNLDGRNSAAMKWEMAYLAFSAMDAAQTIQCLNRGTCEEANPIFGKNPSSAKIILAKLGVGVIHFGSFHYIYDRNPKMALRFAQVSAGLQGSVVLLNARFTFN